MQVDNIKQWITDVMAILGEDEKHLITKGLDIFVAISNNNVVHPIPNVQIEIDNNPLVIPYSLWHEINSNGETLKIASIKKLRAWVKETHFYTPGLRESKECVEDKCFFPGV